MKELLGNAVQRAFMNRDQSVVVFMTPSRPIAFVVVGDCCSTTWFESIEGVESIRGKIITQVTTRDMPDKLPINRHGFSEEMMSYYGYELRAGDGSTCLVEFRNSSNGYYGGECLLTSAPIGYESWPEIEPEERA